MLGERLKLLRISNNLTQKQISLSLNISEARYSQYELGKRNPDYEMLKDIANYYNVSTDYLLGNEKTKTNDKKAIEKEALYNALVENGYIDKGEDFTNEQLKKIFEFVKANKKYIKDSK